MDTYESFLESKISLAKKTGFAVLPEQIHPFLKPHQRDVVIWNLAGGCRADFLNFSLGKTIIQLETARQLILKYVGTNVLFVCPLAVRYEFENDGRKLGIDRIDYITSSDQLRDDQPYYITNYERIRKGDIDASKFIAVFFDEASILRNLDTLTTQAILDTFQTVPFRFVSTATPAPNEYLEFINYAEYLGIMDRGQSLTRFFKRDSTQAGNLQLLPSREREFWLWMSSWACFITSPADLGYDATGYELPPLTINVHRIVRQREVSVDKRTGQTSLTSDASSSLPDAAREKADSINERLDKMQEIIAQHPDDHYILWHHLEAERKAIQKRLGSVCKSVWGNQPIEQREDYMRGFAEGRYQFMSTKPEICGSGVNWQYYCHRTIFVGINYKFNDFLQSLHRNYRFLQTHEVTCDIIHTDAEDEIMKELMRKWNDHTRATYEMTQIIQQYGLNNDLLRAELKREIFTNRQVANGRGWTFVNNDAVDEWKRLPDNHFDLILTSIPFGNHYEYSENYNCFGHNPSNEKFFEQMDYLIPELLRTLKPGRIAAIHVKDRVRYGYQNGAGFISIDPFSDDTSRAFRKHGFLGHGRITIDTDVVRENASSYRLGWSEACKDMTKMGVGLPEYVLLFRKLQTDTSNGYADDPVMHIKRLWDKKNRVWTTSYDEGYSRGRWQIDAHAHWKTAGERLISEEQLRRLGHKEILKLWKALDTSERYDYHRHVQICELLDQIGKLPSGFMAVPPQANSPYIWDDINRMRTLNAEQARANQDQHICPLQLDIIERIVERYSNPGELVGEPFGGIASVLHKSVKMKRRAFGTELKTEYWRDGLKHCRAAEHDKKSLTLFDDQFDTFEELDTEAA